MSTPAHTPTWPTPIHHRVASDGRNDIIAADGQYIGGTVTKADALRLVAAVNSHAALVAALERTLAQLDSLANCTVETQTGLIDPRKSPAYAESRAALAAAKE